MRSSGIAFILTAGVLLSFSCGRAEDSEGSTGLGESGAGGDAGALSSDGGRPVPPPVQCGAQMCRAIAYSGGAVAPCCADPAKEICGADVSALVPTMACQPLTQAGALDQSCPSRAASLMGGIPLPAAPGCCSEATGHCGYWIGNLGGILPFAPGCVDPSVLGAGGASQACGDNPSGAGGMSGGGADDGMSSAGMGGVGPLIEGGAGEGGTGGAHAPL
jgi:hypothetical protein